MVLIVSFFLTSSPFLFPSYNHWQPFVCNLKHIFASPNVSAWVSRTSWMPSTRVSRDYIYLFCIIDPIDDDPSSYYNLRVALRRGVHQPCHWSISCHDRRYTYLILHRKHLRGSLPIVFDCDTIWDGQPRRVINPTFFFHLFSSLKKNCQKCQWKASVDGGEISVLHTGLLDGLVSKWRMSKTISIESVFTIRGESRLLPLPREAVIYRREPVQTTSLSLDIPFSSEWDETQGKFKHHEIKCNNHSEGRIFQISVLVRRNRWLIERGESTTTTLLHNEQIKGG